MPILTGNKPLSKIQNQYLPEKLALSPMWTISRDQNTQVLQKKAELLRTPEQNHCKGKQEKARSIIKLAQPKF